VRFGCRGPRLPKRSSPATTASADLTKPSQGKPRGKGPQATEAAGAPARTLRRLRVDQHGLVHVRLRTHAAPQRQVVFPSALQRSAAPANQKFQQTKSPIRSRENSPEQEPPGQPPHQENAQSSRASARRFEPNDRSGPRLLPAHALGRQPVAPESVARDRSRLAPRSATNASAANATLTGSKRQTPRRWYQSKGLHLGDARLLRHCIEREHLQRLPVSSWSPPKRGLRKLALLGPMGLAHP
jgi:hypothetical protein